MEISGIVNREEVKRKRKQGGEKNNVREDRGRGGARSDG